MFKVWLSIKLLKIPFIWPLCHRGKTEIYMQIYGRHIPLFHLDSSRFGFLKSAVKKKEEILSENKCLHLGELQDV